MVLIVFWWKIPNQIICSSLLALLIQHRLPREPRRTSLPLVAVYRGSPFSILHFEVVCQVDILLIVNRIKTEKEKKEQYR